MGTLEEQWGGGIVELSSSYNRKSEGLEPSGATFRSAAQKNIGRLSIVVILSKHGAFYSVGKTPKVLVQAKIAVSLPAIFSGKS